MRFQIPLATIGTAAMLWLALFPAGSYAESTPVDYTVEATFPAPGPRPQDIAWDGANLWVVDDSTDVVYRLDPADCSVLQTFPAPDGNTQGLTWHDEHLWACGADSLTLYQIAPITGDVLSTIPVSYGKAPVYSSQFHGTGIAFMGEQLLVCFQAQMSSMVATVDLEERTWDLRYFTSTTDPMGLIYAEDYLLCSQGVGMLHQGYIEGYYHADRKASERRIEYTYSEAPSGITYDGQCYWLTDSRDRTITRIRFKDISPSVTEDTPLPLVLPRNHPNPFNPTTTISFTLPEAGTATLSIHDALGRTVATLVNGPMSAGAHSVNFDGSKLASGVYLYRFESAGIIRTGKMLLLR